MDRRFGKDAETKGHSETTEDPESTIRRTPPGMRAAESFSTADVLDAMPDAVLVTDLDGRILFANRGALDLLNVTPAEIFGKPLFHFASDRDASLVRVAIKEVRRGEDVRVLLRMRPRHQRPSLDVELRGRMGATIAGWVVRERPRGTDVSP